MYTKVVAFILPPNQHKRYKKYGEGTYGLRRGEVGAVGGVSEIGLRSPSDLATLVRDSMAAVPGGRRVGMCEDPWDGERVSRIVGAAEEVPFERGDLMTGT